MTDHERPQHATTGGRPLARWRWPWVRRPRTYLILAIGQGRHADMVYTTDFGRLTPEHIALAKTAIQDAFRNLQSLTEPAVTIVGVIELANWRNG